MAKKKIINRASEQFLEAYLNNPSPTGFESEGQKMWLDYIKPYIDEHIVDTYGTVVGVINPKAEYKVVIEAHADEISWFVHYITSDGFIYLRRNGGSDHQIAPSKRVTSTPRMAPSKPSSVGRRFTQGPQAKKRPLPSKTSSWTSVPRTRPKSRKWASMWGVW